MNVGTEEVDAEKVRRYLCDLSLSIYMYTHAHIYTHTCTHICIPIHTHIYIHKYTYISNTVIISRIYKEFLPIYK